MALTEPQVEWRSDPPPAGAARAADGTHERPRRRRLDWRPVRAPGLADERPGAAPIRQWHRPEQYQRDSRPDWRGCPPASGAIGDASRDPSSAATPAAASSARDNGSARSGTGAMATLTDAGARRPTKFLADLTRAMRTAADESRTATLEQFRADAAAYMDEIRNEATVFATQCRERADAEVEALNEWSRTEMDRIRRETEEGIAARRRQLRGVTSQPRGFDSGPRSRSVDATVTGFQSDMERFFERLMQEEEPSTFAAMAGQLPEPPQRSRRGRPRVRRPSNHRLDDDAGAAGWRRIHGIGGDRSRPPKPHRVPIRPRPRRSRPKPRDPNAPARSRVGTQDLALPRPVRAGPVRRPVTPRMRAARPARIPPRSWLSAW